jgi:insertion element IS1 protein InsB
MSYLAIAKKTSRVYVWLAVDRNRNEVVDIKVSNSRDFWAYYEMAQTLEKRYRINILCTDHYEVYSKYRITHRHVKSKAETSLVESKNPLIRHYLSRFNRKTKRYSKALDMIVHFLWMLFYKKGCYRSISLTQIS